tara:strand:+ start:637 stop:1200 length:564 start_codon:yes stop_codon:yes gene_type:complete
MIKNIISVFISLGVLIGQVYQTHSLKLSNNKNIIIIEPDTILKINGSEVSYKGLDLLNKRLSVTLRENNFLKDYNFDDINEINLINKDRTESLADTYLYKYITIGFKRGLKVSTLLSMIVSIFKIKDLEDKSSEEWSISKKESSLIYTIILTPFIFGTVGAILGGQKQVLNFDKSLIFKKDQWRIIN